MVEMFERSNTVSQEAARICLLSARQVRNHVSDAHLYEFEDVIGVMDSVDLFTYDKSPDTCRRIYTLANHVTRSSQLARLVTPDFTPPQVLAQEYDLFVVVLRNIFEAFAIQSIQNWRQKCKNAVCYITESWNNKNWLHDRKYLLEFLKEFDHIFVAAANSVEAIAEITGRPCCQLFHGIDTLRFCPYPLQVDRCIDLASLGRRSAVTHQASLQLAEAGKIFYYYDTGSNLHTMDSREHRLMYANLLKRSRYFIANYANINEPEKTNVEKHTSYRFTEGAAAGTVMIGMAPPTDIFKKHFNWPDAVIPMPFDEPDIGRLIAELDAQPERLARIRQDNVVNSLLRHDWVYRWQEILETVGLNSSEAMNVRRSQLQAVADSIQANKALLAGAL